MTYFEIKWLTYEQDLTLNFQIPLDKCKVYEWTVLSYWKAQGDDPST